MSESTEPTWSYWCPPEGNHYIHPNELQVGIMAVNDEGLARPLLIAAVVPPVHLDAQDHGPEDRYPESWHQMEGFATTIRDALEAGPWREPDGLADWLSAHGNSTPFPRTLPPMETTDG